MRRFSLLLIILCLLPCSPYGQSVSPNTVVKSDVTLEKIWLLSYLQALEAKSVRLDTPLARALAKAEIASAAWTLDQAWAEKLLREAYELTFPDEEEQAKLRSIEMGEALSLPTKKEIARNSMRHHVLEIAGRNKAFAEELVQWGAQKLGRQEENYMYNALAGKAVATGDKTTAGLYIIKALESDPTIINVGYYILAIASRDRAAADALILQYIAILRATQLSPLNDGPFRAYYLLENVVFPSEVFIAAARIFLKNSTGSAPMRIPPASPSVVRAYVSYVIDSIGGLEQQAPGSAMRFRGNLLSVWLPLRQYAPELTGDFIAIERLSRRPDEDSSLPQEQDNKSNMDRYENQVKKALDGDQPDALTIEMVINRGDFDKARKLIGKLSDGDQKSQLLEEVNTQEAISLAAKGDTLEAMRLAEKLSLATSILQAYPVIINKCVANKDQACASSLVYQAMKQLKRASTAIPDAPAGVPSSVAPTNRELDPLLLSLNKFTSSVASINETLALEVLDEMIVAANNSNIDKGLGRIGFDAGVFRKLAPKNEGRTRQAAENLKDPLQQIVALAIIYQWKAEELAKRPKRQPE